MVNQARRSPGAAKGTTMPQPAPFIATAVLIAALAALPIVAALPV